ncbi:MAG TPA: FeoB small GTPase domain-containing protein, partial [Woeseiaceae bacterium]|nr:FeoB small GTPase domain-containing protein [Woeseiaceae bacterium]
MTRETPHRAEIRIPVTQIASRRQPEVRVAVVGNPNSGKSTLFNRLTGLRQRVGNYPGVTVEKHVGVLNAGGRLVELIDLPGTYALSAHSFEEQIAIDVMLGRVADMPAPDGILAVLDATNLYQGLYLLQQLIELGVPVVVALTMADVADKAGTGIDLARLGERLGGVPVLPVVSTTGQGIGELREVLAGIGGLPPPNGTPAWPELRAAAERALDETGADLRRIDVERLLVDGPTEPNRRALHALGPDGSAFVQRAQDALFGPDPPLAA